MAQYYNPNNILQTKDLNKKTPEIFFIEGNRGSGKTFAFKTKLIRDFLNGKGKFAVLVRFQYEITDYENIFFKDIGPIKFPEYKMTSKMIGKGLFNELFLNDESCGYVIAINSADTIKKYSSTFVDVNQIWFDEFQSENNKYCPDEVNKFISIHTSIARGAKNGGHIRYVPVYLTSNRVSTINPYYLNLDITNRIAPNAKIIKGDGWVLEISQLQEVADEISNSAFGKAFKDSKQINYSIGKKVLLDNNNFIEKQKGEKYILTNLKYKNKEFGLWRMEKTGLLYCDTKPVSDVSTISIYNDDHTNSTWLLEDGQVFGGLMKKSYELGIVRFESIECKNAFLQFVKIKDMNK